MRNCWIWIVFVFAACSSPRGVMAGSEEKAKAKVENRGSYAQQMKAALKNSDYEDFCVLTGDRSDVNFAACKGDYTLDRVELIASASKLVSAVVILDLVQEGRLSLSTRVRELFPDWGRDDPLKEQIELRHLLSFTSGLEKERCTNRQILSFDGCVEKIGRSSVKNVPGSHYEYNGAHMHIAGMMAIKASSAENWNDVFDRFKQRHRVFSDDSRFFNIRGQSERNPLPAGGLNTSGRLYAEFLSALLSEKILSSEYLEILFQNYTNTLPVLSSPISSGLGEYWDYAFGVWVECAEATPSDAAPCVTPKRFSSPGAFGFYPWISRDRRYFGIIAQRGSFSIFGSRPDVNGIQAGREFIPIVDSYFQDRSE